MASYSQKRQRLSKSKLREIRQRQRRRQRRLSPEEAQKRRQQLERNVGLLPEPLRSFLSIFSPSFTRPTFLRFSLLLVATILTSGCRTVANLLRTLGCLAPGHPSDYHRIFSQRRWAPFTLARSLAAWIFDHLCGDGPILLAADDNMSTAGCPGQSRLVAATDGTDDRSADAARPLTENLPNTPGRGVHQYGFV